MHLTEIRICLCGPTPATDRRAPGRAAADTTTTTKGERAPNPGAGTAGPQGSRLRAFCSLTFDDALVIRDVKLIEGNGGLFLAMPSRKLADHCPGCNEKNHLRARFCNACGRRLDEGRYLRYRSGNGGGGPARVKLHADIAHPINADCRKRIEREVFEAYGREVERSRQPGYVPPNLDAEDFDFYDGGPHVGAAEAASPARRRPVGSTPA